MPDDPGMGRAGGAIVDSDFTVDRTVCSLSRTIRSPTPGGAVVSSRPQPAASVSIRCVIRARNPTKRTTTASSSTSPLQVTSSRTGARSRENRGGGTAWRSDCHRPTSALAGAGVGLLSSDIDVDRAPRKESRGALGAQRSVWHRPRACSARWPRLVCPERPNHFPFIDSRLASRLLRIPRALETRS